MSPSSAFSATYFEGARRSALDRDRVHLHDVADPPPVVEDVDPVVHQLEEVPVPRHHLHLEVLILGDVSEVGDDVVRLVPGYPEDWDLHHLQDLEDQRYLPGETVGCLSPVALVLGEFRRPLEGRTHVDAARYVVRLLLLQKLDQHRGEPIDRVRLGPVGRG